MTETAFLSIVDQVFSFTRHDLSYVFRRSRSWLFFNDFGDLLDVFVIFVAQFGGCKGSFKERKSSEQLEVWHP